MSVRTYIDTAKFFLSKSINLAHYFRVMYWYAESTKNFTKEAFIKKSAEFKTFDGIKCEGRSFMVTGATSSIGIAVCEYIVKKEGTHLHAICQSESRAAYFTQIITPVTNAKSKFTVHVVDLSEPQIVQKFLQKFIKEKIPLHVLINCASIFDRTLKTNSNGIQNSFALNVIGTYLLLTYFSEYMSQNINLDIKNRIINCVCGDILTVNVHINDPELKLFPKKPLLHFSHEKKQTAGLIEIFSQRYPDIQFSSVCPGWVKSTGLQKLSDIFPLYRLDLRTPEQGADTLLWLAISEEALSYRSGDYFIDRNVYKLSYFNIPNFIKHPSTIIYQKNLHEILEKCLVTIDEKECATIGEKTPEPQAAEKDPSKAENDASKNDKKK